MLDAMHFNSDSDRENEGQIHPAKGDINDHLQLVDLSDQSLKQKQQGREIVFQPVDEEGVVH